MHVRTLLIAGALFANGAAFAAQPAKQPTQPGSESRETSATVVLASAQDVRQPALAEQQPAAQPKRRVARVTTCRCGDAQPSPNR